MTIDELLNYGYKYLHKDQTKLLLGILLNINPLELSIHLKDKVDDKITLKYKKAIEALKKGEPIQYALSSANFYGYDFYVNRNVLIPRFETEELVYNTLQYLNKYMKNAKVLDLCTGSGIIGITMKKACPKLNVTMSDISVSAIEVANINNIKHQTRCQTIVSDLFQNIVGKFDCIISNPPYISQDEEVMELVKNNEPHLALYAKNNGLEFYERIFKEAKSFLQERFIMAFELNSNKSQEIVSLAKEHYPNAKIIVKKDQAERDRMLFIFQNIE